MRRIWGGIEGKALEKEVGTIHFFSQFRYKKSQNVNSKSDPALLLPTITYMISKITTKATNNI